MTQLIDLTFLEKRRPNSSFVFPYHIIRGTRSSIALLFSPFRQPPNLKKMSSSNTRDGILIYSAIVVVVAAVVSIRNIDFAKIRDDLEERLRILEEQLERETTTPQLSSSDSLRLMLVQTIEFIDFEVIQLQHNEDVQKYVDLMPSALPNPLKQIDSTHQTIKQCYQKLVSPDSGTDQEIDESIANQAKPLAIKVKTDVQNLIATMEFKQPKLIWVREVSIAESDLRIVTSQLEELILGQ